MKKLALLLLFFCMQISLTAGGLVTNTNQSAMFTRFQCRDATIDVDAAYYNPAGLVHFSDGFFLSVNNMSIGETWLIESDYTNYNTPTREFNGKVETLVYPSLYAVYKRGKFAFSGSVNIVSGNGIVHFDKGLPSIERQIADIVPYYESNLDLLASGDISSYDLTSEFDIRSFNPGLQFNVAYMINDYWSLAGGLRFVRGRNDYIGYLQGISISGTNLEGEYKEDPVDYLRELAANATGTAADDLNAMADNIDQRIYNEIDAVQLGYGLAPVLSINYAPSLYTNWALKYEFKTNLTLKTEIKDNLRDIVIINNDTVLADGAEVVSDIPAMLSVGLTRRLSNKFMYYTGLHYYFDKPIDYDGSREEIIDMIEKNSFEFAFGAEYKLGYRVRVSAGWLITRPGVNKAFQLETRYSLPSNTIGGGVGIRMSDLIDLNLGFSYTMYKTAEVEREHTSGYLSEAYDVRETYDKRTIVIAVGVDFLFGEN